MATVDEIVVKIRGDLKDINNKLKSLEKNTQDTTSRVTKSFGRIASVAKLAIGAVVVQQLARAGARLVSFGSHVEEMQAKSSVVFGQFAQSVRSELAEFGDAVGRSVFELEEMASSIQDTFVPMGFARGEAADLSVQLTKLATDVASFNNASDAETMRAFQSALVGNHETVRRFGVVITEATIQQELMRMGINKLSTEATNQEKVQARLNILLRGTTDAQGDAARTSTSFANEVKGLMGELQNLGISVIIPLLPTLSKFVGGIKDAVRATRELLFVTGILNNDLKTTAGLEAQVKVLEAQRKNLETTNKANHPSVKANIRLKQQEIDQLKAQIQEIKNFQKKQAEVLEAEEKEARVKQEKASATQRINMAIAEQTKIQNLLTEKLQAGSDAERVAIDAISEHATAFSMLGEEGTELEEKLRNVTIANEKLKEKISDASGQAKKMTPIMKELMSVAQSVGQAFENSFIETLSGTKSALEGFRDMSRQLVEEILRIYIRMSVINPIIRQIFKGQQGFTNDFANQNFPTADASEVFSNVLDLGKKAIGMRAMGGGVVRGQPYMVGERGPEMFVPHSSGNIVPNNKIGGTVINQSLNFTTGIQNTVRAEVMNMLPMIQNATLEAVVDQKRRGGMFAQGMS